VNIDSVIDVAKNINWSAISLDGLLDFIISESKMLLSSTELQNLVIGEFSRRFKEEYLNDDDKENNANSITSRKRVSSGSGGGTNQSNQPKGTQSFTAELIMKLISK